MFGDEGPVGVQAAACGQPAGPMVLDEQLPATAQWQHPPSFYCPISRQCMHDPVVLADGHTYERRYIERWLQHHSTSPVSGLQLPKMDMYPNHALRNAIEEYFQQVFSVHRRAIQQTISASEAKQSLGSNAPLLRTIDALMQCSLLVNADLCVECVLRRIMEEAKTLVDAEVASVFLLDAERQELFSTINSTGIEIRIPAGCGVAGHVAATGEALIIQDAYNDTRFNKNVDLRTGFKTRGIMCVPLKVKRGGIIGVVQLLNKSEAPGTEGGGSFSSHDLQFLQVFASQAATAIANSSLFREHGLEPASAERDSGSDGEACRLGSCSRHRPASASSSDAGGLQVEPACGRAGSGQAPAVQLAVEADCCQSTDHAVGGCCRREARGRPGSCGEAWDRPDCRPAADQLAACSEAADAADCGLVQLGCAGRAPGPLAAAKKRSGRTRQRAAKWRAAVRCRTPSPGW